QAARGWSSLEGFGLLSHPSETGFIDRRYSRTDSVPKALARWMQRLLGSEGEEDFESVSLISSPVRASSAQNRRFLSFGMERRRRNNHLEESDDEGRPNAGTNNDEVIFADPATASRSRLDQRGNQRGGGEEEELQLDPLPPMFSKYGDFHTIDWQRDLARDRLRHKMIEGRSRDFPLGLLKAAWDAGAGWICVLMVGIAAGATAGVIDVAARWMSDLKDGVCADRFWLDREHCCWSSNDTIYKDSDCSAWTTWPEMFNYYSKSPFYYLVELFFYVAWAVGMSTLAVLLVKVFAPYACGSGIPEIKCILSGFIIRGYLGKWTFLIKSVGLILASASGLSLGKEGPMVHLGCCIGNIISYLFPKYGQNEAKKREILSASAAAGVSVAFGAPIGGVMFSLEEASYYFPQKTMWRSFFCALVAGIVLRLVNPFGSDQTSLFHVDYMVKWSFIELIPFGLLGIFGGLVGALFTALNIRWCRVRKENKMVGGNPIYEVVLVTLFTAAISYFNPYLHKSGTAVIKQLFDRCGPEDYMVELCEYRNVDGNVYFGSAFASVFWQLSVALVMKFVFTIFTFGIKIPCGLFVPSLVMGSLAGRLLAMLIEGFLRAVQDEAGTSMFSCQIGKDCMMPGLYAMVGAAAVLGGMTRMTVSLVVIMFELTGSLEFIVPTMVAVMFAKWVGDATHKQGMYEAHIELNGYPFLDNKGEYPYSTTAYQVMRPSADRSDGKELAVIVQDTMTLGEIEQLMRDTQYNGFPVVVSRESMYLVGYVTRRELQLALHAARQSQPYVVTASRVYFTAPGQASVHQSGGSGGEPSSSVPAPLKLRRIIDLAPMTVTDQMPMETIIDMFRKLGLRQLLVTRSGKVLGIITKKDILHFMRNASDHESIINPNFK
ncbi:clh-5, partial [Pristionchus pacificus]